MTAGSEMISPDDDDTETARAREAEHRARNALQLISSLILLQGRHSPDAAAGPAMASLLTRVAAVSAAHRQTVQVHGREQVDLAALIREIVGDLAKSAGRDGVTIDLSLEPILAPGRLAPPLALLLNETVGNALGHAFPGGRTGRIRVALRRQDAGFELDVNDDGAGTPSPTPTTGFGLTVVKLMVQQIRGQLDITELHPGLRVSVTVPLSATQSKR